MFLDGLFSKGADGYSVAGKLWRNGVSSLTGGTIDVLGISQHNRDLKSSGEKGANWSALFSGIGAGVMAGQDQFMNYTPTNGASLTAQDAMTKGGVNYYLQKYLPWVIIGAASLVGIFFLIFKKRR